MAEAQNKTQPVTVSFKAYVDALPNEAQKKEARILAKLFKETTGMKPVLWGNIVGFGSYHFKYDSGREGDFLATGFALRKSGPTLYVMPGYQDYGDLLKKLGPHKLGKSCLYLKSLEDIDTKVLQQLIKTGLKDLGKVYPVQKS